MGRDEASGGAGQPPRWKTDVLLIVQFAGDEKFFVGSDYPHAEDFVEPVRKARETLSALPAESVDKILGGNASRFFGI